MILYMMGVSGSGKSTIGTLLAESLNIPFADGDNYHPAANKHKMAQGMPLDDADRKPWLAALNQLARTTDVEGKSIVIACSALKSMYRDWLSEGLPPAHVRFILLEGSKELISERLRARHHEFMNPNLLDSQLAILEEPADAISIVNDAPVDVIVARIVERLDAVVAKR